MNMRKDGMTEELKVQEDDGIRELNEWAEKFRTKEDSLNSYWMNRHRLRKKAQKSTIGPSNERVKELLESCARKLGVSFMHK